MSASNQMSPLSEQCASLLTAQIRSMRSAIVDNFLKPLAYVQILCSVFILLLGTSCILDWEISRSGVGCTMGGGVWSGLLGLVSGIFGAFWVKTGENGNLASWFGFSIISMVGNSVSCYFYLSYQGSESENGWPQKLNWMLMFWTCLHLILLSLSMCLPLYKWHQLRTTQPSNTANPVPWYKKEYFRDFLKFIVSCQLLSSLAILAIGTACSHQKTVHYRSKMECGGCYKDLGVFFGIFGALAASAGSGWIKVPAKASLFWFWFYLTFVAGAGNFFVLLRCGMFFQSSSVYWLQKCNELDAGVTVGSKAMNSALAISAGLYLLFGAVTQSIVALYWKEFGNTLGRGPPDLFISSSTNEDSEIDLDRDIERAINDNAPNENGTNFTSRVLVEAPPSYHDLPPPSYEEAMRHEHYFKQEQDESVVRGQ